MTQIEVYDAPLPAHVVASEEQAAAPADDLQQADFSSADIVGRAGEPLSPGEPIGTPEKVISLLRMVYDPEIPVNLYDLGLIYQYKIDEAGDVFIAMSLTAPGCPVAGSLPQQVADVVASDDGFGEVTVALVWDPPWTPARLSDDARMMLDMF